MQPKVKRYIANLTVFTRTFSAYSLVLFPHKVYKKNLVGEVSVMGGWKIPYIGVVLRVDFDFEVGFVRFGL